MSAEPARPLLLPQNRKLRHLRGISLRNLVFAHPRKRTIDDAALNKTAAKLESLRATPQLHHALSSEDLRPQTARRRSTNLPSASPVTRQKQFEDAFDSRLADAFFSFHVEGDEDPVYVSEVLERATVRLDMADGLDHAWLTWSQHRTSTSVSSSSATSTHPSPEYPR